MKDYTISESLNATCKMIADEMEAARRGQLYRHGGGGPFTCWFDYQLDRHCSKMASSDHRSQPSIRASR